MSDIRYFLRTTVVFASLACVTVSLGSCSLAKNQLQYDRGVRKDIQDYRDVLSPKPEDQAKAEAPAPVPDFQSVVATPNDLKLPAPLVTVSVNQTVSLRDLMFELSEQAGIDLEMDPQIHGSIIFTAKERPFNEVVDRICELAGLRYSYQNDILHVELDRPYIKNYNIEYMSSERSSTSDISTGITSSSASDTQTAQAGSNSHVTSKYDSDFWKDLETGLKQALAASDTYLPMASADDPVAVPDPPPAAPVQLDASGKPIPSATPPAPVTQPPSLNVSMPSSGARPANAAATYSISKQTGIISVFATDRQQKMVQQFLDTYRRQALTQVLIEAKVLEVDLTDEYASGIDWGGVHDILHLGALKLQNTLPAPGFDPIQTGNTFTADIDLGNGFQPVISALSRFGTVRALSSPRVTVMNNQPAVVNVATNLVYFNIKATTQAATSTSSATTTYDVTQKSAPEGVLLNVVPTANADTGQVILAMRPTVSKKVGDVSDPSITLNGGSAAIPNKIPIMSVQEIDSIIKMQSGQTLVMGGLMKDANSVNQLGIPVLGDVPYVGNLFRSHGDKMQKSELVIFIRARIIPGGNIDNQDRGLYKNFGNDSRPAPM